MMTDGNRLQSSAEVGIALRTGAALLSSMGGGTIGTGAGITGCQGRSICGIGLMQFCGWVRGRWTAMHGEAFWWHGHCEVRARSPLSQCKGK